MGDKYYKQENGKLVAYDRDTDEQVPVDLAEITPDQIGTEDDPVQDTYSESVDAGSVNTDEVSYTGMRENPHASNEDDFSDQSIFYQRKAPTSATDYTLLDVSDGPATLQTLFGQGYEWRAVNGVSGNYGKWQITVDGTTNSEAGMSGVGQGDFEDQAGDFMQSNFYGQHLYESSLKIEWRHTGTGGNVTQVARILGTGPHTAAIVADGKPVYGVAQRLSDEQIEDMSVPDGYKVVKNPVLSHPDPMVRGAWDDANGTVVDHDYWAPFYDSLDKSKTVAQQYGPREFLANVDTPADRGEIPVETPDPSKGTATPDPSSSTPTNDAVAFLKDQWDDDLPSSI